MFDITLRPLKETLFNPLVPLIPSFITPLHLTLAAFISGLLSCYVTTLNHQTSSPVDITLTPLHTRLTALSLWLINRILDCLDGAVARHRNTASDLGGFLDLLGDFVVYSAIPIACGIAAEQFPSIEQSQTAGGPEASDKVTKVGSSGLQSNGLWLSIAVLEATFHVNNFVLFYVGAVIEKRRAAAALSRLEGSAFPSSASSPSTSSGSKPQSRSKTAAKEGASEVDDDQSVKELTSTAMRPALIEGAESGVIFTVMLACPQYTAAISWAMAAAVAFGVCQRTWWVWGVLS